MVLVRCRRLVTVNEFVGVEEEEAEVGEGS